MGKSQDNSISRAQEVHEDADAVCLGVDQQQRRAVADGIPASTIAGQLPLSSALTMERLQQLGALSAAVEFTQGAGTGGRAMGMGEVAEGDPGLQQPHPMQQLEIPQQRFHPSSWLEQQQHHQYQQQQQQPYQMQQQQQQQHNQWHSSTSGTSIPKSRGGLLPFRSPQPSVSIPTDSDAHGRDFGPHSPCSLGGPDAGETPTPTKDPTLSEMLCPEGMKMEGRLITGDAVSQWPCTDVDMPSVKGATRLAEGRGEIPAEGNERGGLDEQTMLGELKVQPLPGADDNWGGKVSEVIPDSDSLQKQRLIDDLATNDGESLHDESHFIR